MRLLTKIKKSLNRERKPSKPKVNKSILFVMIGCLIFILIYGLVLVNKRGSKIRKSQQKIITLNTSLNIKSKQLKTLQEDKEAVERLSKKLESKEKLLLEREKVSPKLDEITRLAEKNNLRISSFKPSTTSQEQYYSVTSVQMVALGQFDDIYQFLDEFRKQEYLTAIDKFILTRQSGPDNMILLNFIFNLYSKPPPQEAKKKEK